MLSEEKDGMCSPLSDLLQCISCIYARTHHIIFIGIVFYIDDGSMTRYFQKLRLVLAKKMKKIVIKHILMT